MLNFLYFHVCALACSITCARQYNCPRQIRVTALLACVRHNNNFISNMLINLFLCAMLGAAIGAEPNPPTWPASVQVFDPSAPTLKPKSTQRLPKTEVRCTRCDSVSPSMLMPIEKHSYIRSIFPSIDCSRTGR